MPQHPAKDGPDQFDVLVGQRIKRARMAKGASQSSVAHALGLSFQQVQKYENGINRVAPSRLRIIAQTLGQPISYFVGEPDDVAGMHDAVSAMAAMKEGHRLARAFISIGDDELRGHLVALIEYIAGTR